MAAQPEPVKEEADPELTEEEKSTIDGFCTKFLSSFAVESDKQPSLNQLKLVFNMIKNPNNKNIAENFKTIQLSNEKFRRIKSANSYFIEFLTDIGFTKTDGGECPQGNDLKFKFIKPEDKTEESSRGNTNNIVHVLSHF